MEEKKQVSWLEGQASKWGWTTEYRDEIERRMQYLDGDMEADGLDLLKQEFKNDWKAMQDKMVEWSVTKYIIEKKAQTFTSPSQRFYLESPDGKEIPAASTAAEIFEELIEAAGVEQQLILVDQTELLCNGVAGKAWWDFREKHAVLSKWDPDKTVIAVNPIREFDPYSAFAVGFERTGSEGLGSPARYEIFGMSEVDNPGLSEEYFLEMPDDKMIYPTQHYMASTSGKSHFNTDDSNPFVDADGNAIYPFTWFRSRQDYIYWAGGDDLVRMNRLLNLGLTYMHHCATWMMCPQMVFETPGTGLTPEQEKKIQGIKYSSPTNAWQLPAGVSISFAQPDGDLAQFQNLYEFLIQYHALLNQLSPKSIDISGGLPQSGIAMKIELDGLIKLRKARIKILYKHVIDMLQKLIIVHNTYSSNKIPSEFTPVWEPGVMEAGPTDYVELGQRMENEIAYDVSSSVDWCMEVYNLNREEAIKRLAENSRLNQIQRDSRRVDVEVTGFEAEEAEIDELTEPEEPEEVIEEPEEPTA